MFYWGAGPTLGLLTCLGYCFICLGCVYFWRHRQELSHWMEDEFCSFRRNLSRFESIGPFYLPRTESRLRVIPAGVLLSVSRFPRRRRFSLAAFLLIIGLVFCALDFFV
ncbi:MAG TPA: hypothetical protein VLX60_12030 [Terriglobales bacterium]|nr:hypothetical protein [Terriglobales bacterium]